MINRTLLLVFIYIGLQIALNPLSAKEASGIKSGEYITGHIAGDNPRTLRIYFRGVKNSSWGKCYYYDEGSAHINRQVYDNIKRHAPLAIKMIDSEMAITNKLCGKPINNYASHVVLHFILEGYKIEQKMKLNEMDLDRVTDIAIHEYAHHFTDMYLFQHPKSEPKPKRMMTLYLDTIGEFNVKINKTFPSRKLIPRLGKTFSTFYYKRYIQGPSSYAVQNTGIYGLLNEFHAYYQGNVAYNSIRKKKIWKGYINNRVCEPFYDFKLWILEYLLLAKEEYPDIYEQMADDRDFFIAFTNLHDRHEKLCDDRMNLKSKGGKAKLLKVYAPHLKRFNSAPLQKMMKLTYQWADRSVE